MVTDSTFSRRRLIEAGSAAGALLYLGMDSPAAFATPGTRTLTSSGAAFLRRATYAGLATPNFATAALVSGTAVVLKLTEVTDLPRAASVQSLRGNEDAFVLTFHGRSDRPLESGIHQLEHRDLGQFELFISPVGAPGADNTYEAVIDRTLREKSAVAAAPTPDPQVAAPAPAAPAAPSAGAAKPGGKPAKKPWLNRATARRKQNRLIADLVLARSGGTVNLTLTRGKTVFAKGRGAVAAKQVSVPMRAIRRVPAGRYDLVVTFTRSSGPRTTARRRITLR